MLGGLNDRVRTMHMSAEDIRRIDRDRVQRARQEPMEEKLVAGIELFELACEFARAGIRMQQPQADAATVEDILRRRLAIAREMEDRSA